MTAVDPPAGSPSQIERRSFVADILRDRGEDLLVVAGLGSPCWDVAAAGDVEKNFYVWGAMGGAAMVALGLALAQPEKRVLVIVGDGEMLMGLGSLTTIAARKPKNLALLVLDNEHYAETGNQPTHTAAGVDLAGVARSCGFGAAYTIASSNDQPRARAELLGTAGPLIVVAKIGLAPLPLVLPPRDGFYLKSRFRRAVLGAEA